MTTPLPPNDPTSPDDKLPGEADLAALYRQLPKREPGPALDAAVLRAAAQAIGEHDAPRYAERRKSARESGDWVHPKPLSAIAARAIPSVESAARTRRRRVPHWLVALGSAASLVLVAGLAWHMRTTPTAVSAADTTASEQAPLASAPAAKPYAERGAAAPSEPAAMASKRRAVAADNSKSVAPVVAETTPPSAPNHAAALRESAPAAKAQAMQQRAAEAPPPAPPPMQPARLEVRAYAPVAAPAPAPAPPPADIVQDGAQAAWANLATPAEQLARIEQLFAQGEQREAQQHLLEFHRVHPQWPLSPELRAKLPKP